MAKRRVYVESSVISNLTARPSHILIKLAKQQQTWDWWESRNRWELFISPLVVQEILRGDPEAARKRLSIAVGLPLISETDEARQLAVYLISSKAVPEKAFVDALHIAIATVNRMDYLLTWNQTHLFNPDTIEKLYKTVREAGYTPSVLIRPDNLLEAKHGS